MAFGQLISSQSMLFSHLAVCTLAQVNMTALSLWEVPRKTEALVPLTRSRICPLINFLIKELFICNVICGTDISRYYGMVISKTWRDESGFGIGPVSYRFCLLVLWRPSVGYVCLHPSCSLLITSDECHVWDLCMNCIQQEPYCMYVCM
jgi:hypothetical protein